MIFYSYKAAHPAHAALMLAIARYMNTVPNLPASPVPGGHGGANLIGIRSTPNGQTAGGGQERRIVNEMAGMQARGHQVHLATRAGAQIIAPAQAANYYCDDFTFCR